MLSKLSRIKLTGFILLILLSGLSYPTHGSELIPLTLEGAISLAFQENPQLKLDRWENALLEQEKKLTGHLQPTIKLSTKPFHIADGNINPPSADFALNMPITDQTSLQSTLNIKFIAGAVKAEPSGTIGFHYQLFSPNISNLESPLDPEIALENNLILSLTQLLINLRKSLNDLALEDLRLEFYQQSHEKATLAENSVEIERANQSITSSEQRIFSLEQSVDEYNLELSYFLNQPLTRFNPVISFGDYQLEYQHEVYMEKIRAFNQELLSAQNAVINTENEITATNKSLGWAITSSADLNWNTQPQKGVSWSVNLAATKQLYPQKLLKEQRELKLAQAELNLTKVERRVADQAERLLESITGNQEKRETLENKIVKAKSDIEDIQRRYVAGLATELNMKEKQLSLISLEIELEHLQYGYINNVLQLLHKSGYQLTDVIPQLIIQGGA